MRRWKLIGLIILMLVSLMGIISTQLVWVQNAVGVRNDLFNQSVFQSLQSTARKLESARQLAFYERMIKADSLLQSQANEMIISSFPNNYRIPEELMIVPKQTNISESFSINVRSNGELHLSGDYIEYYLKDDSDMNQKKPLDNIVSIATVDVNKDEFSQWVIRKSNELQEMGDKMIKDIYDWDLNTETNRNDILSVLYTELSNSGVSTPFEFAIIENNKVVDGIFNSAVEADFLASNYSIRLFSDHLMRKNVRLSLVFPKRKGFILGSMSLLLSGSLLFSLIILLTFSLSIFFILRQKKVSQMKSDFINNMTHEFKTPIATISLAADTISNPRIINDQGRVKHFVSMIKKENTRMNKQVENILQISSLDKQEIEFFFSDIDMHSIIRRSIETIEIQVEGKNGRIFFYPESEDPFVYGDKEHLTNLVHNLLDNANKYSRNEPEITIRTENRDGSFILSVEDKGQGMTKSVQSKIFDRFYRQTSGNVHNVKGFGLGLSYVKAIIEAHQGNIQVYSEIEKGTRFEVYLPQNESIT